MAGLDTTISGGAAAKLHTWPKSGRAGKAQKPPLAAAGPPKEGETSSLAAPSTVSSMGRSRLPRMKGVGVIMGLGSRAAEMEEWEEELLRRETETVEKLAGVVPVPVAAMMEGSAWRRSHSMVWPSDLWPSSRVSWKTLAAQMMGMRMRRPLPSTLLCRSFAGGFFTTRAPLGGCCRCWFSIIAPLAVPSEFDMDGSI